MNLKEYLNGLKENDKVTFIIAEPLKEVLNSFNEYRYKTTPIRCVWEWLQGTFSTGYTFEDYLVVNKDHPPIDITGNWVNWYNRDDLKCCMITKREDMYKMYSEKQANDMIAWYEKTVK